MNHITSQQQDIIKFIEECDFRNPRHLVCYTEIFNNKGFDFLNTDLESPLIFYRARIHKEPKTIYTDRSQLGAPPKSVVGVGRANFPSEPIHYCSNSFWTAIIECRPKVGDYITITTVEFNLDKLHILLLGKTSQYPSLKDKLDGHSLFINDIMDEAFRENVPHHKKYRYYKTACFVSSHLPNLKNGKFHGICYPSVATDHRGDNYIFLPDFVKQNSEIKDVRVVEVIEKESEFDFKIVCRQSMLIMYDEDVIYNYMKNCDSHVCSEEFYFHNDNTAKPTSSDSEE